MTAAAAALVESLDGPSEAADLVGGLRAAGVELYATAAGRPRFVGLPGVVTPAVRETAARCRPALVRLIVGTCPGCGGPADEKRRCWRCHDRACSTCGRPTGSAFIALCNPCGLTDTRTSSGA